MISKYKFSKLNIKQKIYKLTASIRECERKLSLNENIDNLVLDSYIKFLKEENHPKTNKALAIIEKHISGISPDSLQSLKVKVYNLCFHELLELMGEPIKEEYYETTKVKIFDQKIEKKVFDLVMILDNIRSPFNVGSMFRTSDCMGVKDLVLCGITPRPPMPKIERTSMDTVKIVNWKYFNDTAEAVLFYKNEDCKIFAVETVENSIRLYDVDNFNKKAFIFGNEEFGITKEILSLCDEIVEKPFMGIKNSLNVANAFAIVSYEAMRKSIGK